MTERAVRPLTLLDCVGIGINGIIGSGIYLLLAPLARMSGPASVAGVLGCGLLCILIALCFAELSGMVDRSGGAYVYAGTAMGPAVGFAVGWMSMATGVLALSAVSVGFAEAVAHFVPALNEEWMRVGDWTFTSKTMLALALINGLGLLNYVGVKEGARASTVLSLAKVIPLVALAIWGLSWIRSDVAWGVVSSASLPEGKSYLGAVSGAAFLAVFMISGFEYTAVPAGEVKNPQRNIPIAIVGSLIGATALYCMLLLVSLSAVPGLSQEGQPLIAVARAVWGEGGARLLGVAAIVSMAGFCAGSALVGPRYFSALATDGFLPSPVARVSRFGTPGVAILLSSMISSGLAVFWGYASLVDVSNVALFGQYIPACISVAVLRRKFPDAPRRYRLPGGDLIPIAATGISVLLLWAARPQASEWRFSAVILGAGGMFWLAQRLLWPHRAAPTVRLRDAG